MTNQDSKENWLPTKSGSDDEVQRVNKEGASKSEYVCDLPKWDLVPPAAFVVRRVRRR